MSLFLFHSLRSLFASRCHPAQQFLQEVLPAAASRAAQHSLPTSPGSGYLPLLTPSHLARLASGVASSDSPPDLTRPLLWMPGAGHPQAACHRSSNPILVGVCHFYEHRGHQPGCDRDPSQKTLESVLGQSVFISSLLHHVPTLLPGSKHIELALTRSSLLPSFLSQAPREKDSWPPCKLSAFRQIPGQPGVLRLLCHNVVCVHGLGLLLKASSDRSPFSFVVQDHSRNVCNMGEWRRGPGATPSSPCPI